MPDHPLTPEQLGAQYREAKASIAPHRVRQARAELALHRLTRRHHGPDTPEITAARERVSQTHGAVQWCRAVTVAAGEAYKGVTLAEAMAAGLADRRNLPPVPPEPS